MKTFKIISWLIFTSGLILKFLHYPPANELLISGSILLLIHSIIYAIKLGRNIFPESLLYFSFSFWTIYLVLRLLFWNVGPSILGFPLLIIISTLITLVYFATRIIKNQKFKLPQIALTLYFLFSIVLSFTHADKVFYIIKLNVLVNGESRKLNYYSWDKYSWFLFKAGKKMEALEANNEAMKALDYNLEKTGRYDFESSDVIKSHKESIMENNWTNYP